MAHHRRRRPKNRLKNLLFMGVLLAVFMSAWVWGGAVFNANTLRDVAVARLHDTSGQTLAVKGAPQFTLFPAPTLSLPLVEITPAEPHAPRLRIDKLQIGFNWSALFDNSPTPASLTLKRATVEIELNTNNTPDFGWLEQFWTQASASASPLQEIALSDSRVVVLDSSAEAAARFDQLTIRLQRKGNRFISTGGFRYGDLPLHFDVAISDGNAEAQLSKDASNYLHFKGTWQGTGDELTVLGALKTVCGTLCTPPMQPAAAPAAPPANYIANATIAYAQKDRALHLTGLTLQGPGTKGQGSADMLFQEHPVISTTIAFSQINIEAPWLRALAGASAADQDQGVGALPPEEKALPGGYDLTLNITADELLLAGRALTHASFGATLSQGNLSIDHLNFSIPSNGEVAIAGRIYDTARGMRFQGTSQAHGDSLRALLGLFDPTAATYPENAFGTFSINSNLFLSSTQLRLSEADVHLGELGLQGGLVTYFEKTPRVEAQILLNDINLDYFRNSWRDAQRAAGTHDFIFKITSSVNLAWLRQLVPLVDLRVRLHGFTFLDHHGTEASFKISARKNEFGFRDIEMHYPEGDLKGNIIANVGQEIPSIDVALDSPFLDTAYFSSDSGGIGTSPLINPQDSAHRWSEELFDFSWMIGVSSTLDFKAGQFTHRGTTYGNFTLQGTLAHEQFQCTKLAFDHFGGHLDARGTLAGGKVPGLSASFTLYNNDLPTLLSSFSGLNEPQGRVSISGTMVTSGIHLRSWVEQADIKMIVAARGVKVPGFNLKAVIDSVNGAESVADVGRRVERILPTGTTPLSADGNINIQQGILIAPNIKLTSGKAIGALTAEWRLIPWTLRMSTLWQLPMLPSETVPTLTLDVAGTPESHTLKTDTSSLEAYVAKRIVGR